MSYVYNTFKGKVGFAVGTGRCGTYFLYKIFSKEPHIASSHERNVMNEVFHRYCKWYGLSVDDGGFLHTKRLEIEEDLRHHEFSFESSAHLSLSIVELFQEFGAKFVLLVRRPDRVVNSYLHKGWYKETYVRSNPHLALGYQNTRYFHWFLGRIVPSGEEFLKWQQLTRVGKIAWYWSALNEAVLAQFEKIPASHWMIVRLEDLDYEKFQKIGEFLGVRLTVGRDLFTKVAHSRPNKRVGVPTVADWNEQESYEFEQQVAKTAQKFGYEYRIDYLRSHSPPQNILSRRLPTLPLRQKLKAFITYICRRWGENS